MSATTKQRRKQRVSRHGNAPPKVTKSRRQFRWRNRYLRASVWVFLAAFIVSALGIAIVGYAHR
jgi:hypothetical protein